MATENYVTYGWIAAITAIIAGKWAMELGFRQWQQLLWMIAGFLVPPLALLALYVRLIRQREARASMHASAAQPAAVA